MPEVAKGLVPINAEVERLSPSLTPNEQAYLRRAAKLFTDQYYDHSLLDLWNAAVCNLRRRVEAYGVELFLSTVKEESGRKKYYADGDSLNERWEGVDELVLIAGATRLGLLNKKAGKALEMINWTRNHISPAHPSEETVLPEDVYALFLLLQKNLFEHPMPEVGHSISALFDPVKTVPMAGHAADLVRDQIRGLRSADVRVAFGFLLDMRSLASGYKSSRLSWLEITPDFSWD